MAHTGAIGCIGFHSNTQTKKHKDRKTYVDLVNQHVHVQGTLYFYATINSFAVLPQASQPFYLLNITDGIP